MTGDTDVDYYGMRSDRGLTVETQRRLAECNILFTTPEKMEILSRRWGTLAESSAFASRMRLLLIGAGVAARSLADEVHLLNEPRGASIETIISRLRRSLLGGFSCVVRAFLAHQQSFSQSVILDNQSPNNQNNSMQSNNTQSNTQRPKEQLLPRIITLSATLPNGEDVAQWLHAKYFAFDETYRSVPIRRVVIGYPNQSRGNPFLFEVTAAPLRHA